MNMIRVLHVINGMGSGGAESFIMNIYRNIDTSRLQFDFLIKTNDLFYENEIKNRGGNIYIMPSFPRHAVANIIQTKKFFETHTEYDVIHIHSSSLAYFVPLMTVNNASKAKIVLHSHSTDSRTKLYRFLHFVNRKVLVGKTDYRIACSEKAGEWMFDKYSFEVVPNAIDVRKFEFSFEKRKRIRLELEIGNDEIVVGHVGRFLPVKNHSFIIKVFKEFLKLRNNSRLVLVGTGPLMDQIKEEAKDINDRIVYVGEVKNVECYMSAFDVFLFPSIYEGLGIALIEAQASGVPCLVSDAIPSEAIILDNIKKLTLSASEKRWAGELYDLCQYERTKDMSELYRRGYDILSLVEFLYNIYVE